MNILPGFSGHAAELIRHKDWSRHPLGEPAGWPVSLRLMLGAMLRAPGPMYLVWGADRSFFFNDAYLPILGPRLKEATGARFEALWHDAWPSVEAAFLKAEAGEPSRFVDAYVPMARHGVPEMTWWSFSFSGVPDESGSIAGVLCQTEEVTDRVLAACATRDREARNTQILDSATDFAIIATDLDGKVTRWNEGAHRVLGWSEQEMLGDDVERFFVPEDVADGRPATEMRLALKTGHGNDERWHLRKNGERFWASGEMAPLRGADDAIIGFVKVLRDRSEQRLAAESLEASEAQLADALFRLRRANADLATAAASTAAERDRMWEMSPDLLHVISTAGILERVNPAWTAILGYAPEDLVGTPARPLLHPDDVAAYDHALQASAFETLAPLVNRLRHKDGSYRWFTWLSAPAGDVIYAAGRHVTAEKESEAKLRDTQDFARLALGAIGGVGVWVYDMPSDRYAFDDAIAALYGVDPARGVEGLPREEFLANVHPEDRAFLGAAVDQGARVAGDIELEYRIQHADGSIRWVLSRGHTYVGDDGQALRRTGIGVDVTSQRLVEEQLRQSQKVEAVGQLTGGVAHDFNNLLTIIRGSIDLLRRPGTTEARRERYLEAISSTTDRAAKLTNQLLAFARRQALKPEVFDVGASVCALGDMLGTLCGPRVAISIDAGGCPCFVDADRSQFDTAVVNMAVNARDAMQGRGELRISVSMASSLPGVRAHPAIAGEFVTVALTDTGSGIPTDLLDRIFEPFFTTKGVGQGTGLGLSQVFGFAKQSGGDIIATSDEGRGSTFTIYVPKVDAPDGIATGDEAVSLTNGESARVLIVEDNPEVGIFATQALAELGYATSFAADAPSALAELKANPGAHDVVFSDVVMPGMSGIELGQEIRRLYPSLPVVLTSGYSTILAENGSHGFELLRKPYSLDELSVVLRKASTWRGASRGQ
ncbi:hybrid sensor histidine kinase/response regulator [Sphingomonas bacterium]|uniref:hybrid sensor histidine kinase/response regulator n=1 Tax=Sphingomonas bacterium TaxID=1895847 RepID=UPI001575E819|nr:PAS domain-containing sensor histidine kinase [Sphingomonas bacterium]